MYSFMFGFFFHVMFVRFNKLIVLCFIHYCMVFLILRACNFFILHLKEMGCFQFGKIMSHFLDQKDFF